MCYLQKYKSYDQNAYFYNVHAIATEDSLGMNCFQKTFYSKATLTDLQNFSIFLCAFFILTFTDL